MATFCSNKAKSNYETTVGVGGNSNWGCNATQRQRTGSEVRTPAGAPLRGTHRRGRGREHGGETLQGYIATFFIFSVSS